MGRFCRLAVALFVIGSSFVGGAFVTSSRRIQQRRITILGSSSTENRIQNGIRGENYGSANNSTIPTAQECAEAVGVKPPLEVSSKTWKRAWNIQMKALPILHLFDPYKPPDSKLSLSCLWWKALSANDENSPCFDDSLAYDLLPRGFRVLVGRKLRRFYPRLHHANVEIRTAYLDQSVTSIIERVRAVRPETCFRLVTFGGGYDVRSIKFRERGLIDEAVELDLPQVVEAKTRILESRRFQKRRPNLTSDKFPKFYSVNLNAIDNVSSLLVQILQSSHNNELSWHTIFLFEGVMIYLDEGVPEALLKVCSEALQTTGESGSLVFADRLENIPGGDAVIGQD